MKHNKILLRLVFLLISQAGLALTGALLLQCGLGSPAFNLLTEGIERTTGISVGVATMLLHGSQLLPLLFFARHTIGAGSIVSIFAIGPMMDVFMALFRPAQALSLPLRCGLMVLALALSGFCVALQQHSNLGMAPNDGLAVFLSEKLQKRASFRVVRVCYDLLQLVIGVILGGVFGIGTVLGALTMGPVVQATLSLLRRIAPTEAAE